MYWAGPQDMTIDRGQWIGDFYVCGVYWHIQCVPSPGDRSASGATPVSSTGIISTTPPVVLSQGFWGLNSRPHSNWLRCLPNSAVPSAIKSLCYPGACPGRAIFGEDEPAAFSESWGTLHFLPWVSSLSLPAVVVVPGSPGSRQST